MRDTWIMVLLALMTAGVGLSASAKTRAQSGVIVERPTGGASEGRHGQFHKKFLSGPHYTTGAATFFGGKDAEEFVSAAVLEDGRIVALGNAWGPSFPATPRPVVLGKGRHSGQPLKLTKKKKPEPNAADRSGFLAVYSADATRLRSVVRLDWGVGSITTGRSTADGGAVIIAGRCGPNFASLRSRIGKVDVLPYVAPTEQPDDGKKKRKKRVDPSKLKDVYIARITPAGKIEWAVILDKAHTPPARIFSDKDGKLWFNAGGLFHVQRDGSKVTKFSSRKNGRTAKWLGVHPDGKAAFYGGDRNTNTGAEPYRQPYLYKYGKGDEKQYTLWEPTPRLIGAKGDGSNLMSDSSPRAMAVLPDGTLLISGWSDGGNSVFTRQPLDHRKKVPSMGMGMSSWGMKSANSLAHLMIVDDQQRKTLAHTVWLSYVPSWFTGTKYRGAPNNTNIDHLTLTESGRAAFTGRAATGLIQTPGCYWEDPQSGDKYGGSYVAILRPDLTNAMFSSYLPGCSDARVTARGDDVIVTSRTKGNDGREQPTDTVTARAAQPTFGGGFDGHLILLVAPKR